MGILTGFLLTYYLSAFSSYGGFWLSYAAILIPGSGIGDAYATAAVPGQEDNAIGIFLASWFIITFLFLYVYSFSVAGRLLRLHLQPWFLENQLWLDGLVLLPRHHLPPVDGWYVLSPQLDSTLSKIITTGKFADSVAVTKAGGAFGIITAFIAYYCGTCQLLTSQNSLFTLPIGTIHKRTD